MGVGEACQASLHCAARVHRKFHLSVIVFSLQGPIRWLNWAVTTATSYYLLPCPVSQNAKPPLTPTRYSILSFWSGNTIGTLFPTDTRKSLSCLPNYLNVKFNWNSSQNSFSVCSRPGRGLNNTVIGQSGLLQSEWWNTSNPQSSEDSVINESQRVYFFLRNLSAPWQIFLRAVTRSFLHWSKLAWLLSKT